MNARQKQPHRPREVISLTNYTQLELYLAKFAAGSLGLVLLIGRHGTGKSESVRRSLAGQAGLQDWRISLLQMVVSDPRAGFLLALQQDPSLATEKDRVDRFVAATGCSRATYFRMKAKFNSEI